MNLSKKRDVLNLLNLKQNLGVDPYNKGYSHMNEKKEKNLDLTRVRLCFSVSIKLPGDETLKYLPPVYTQIINHNMNKSELQIREISDATSSSAGEEKKF